jgi:hypothetical protein
MWIMMNRWMPWVATILSVKPASPSVEVFQNFLPVMPAFFRRASFLLLKLHHFRGDTVVFQVQLSMSKMRISPTRMPYGKLTVCELEDGHL